MPAWFFILVSRDTFGWPSLPTLALGVRPALAAVPPAPTAVAPLPPRPGGPLAGPRPALPEGAEVSVDLLRAMPPRIEEGPRCPPHHAARGAGPCTGAGAQEVVIASPRRSAACW